LNSCEEVCSELVVASGDAPEVLETTKHALDGIAVAVEEGAEAAFPSAIFLKRDVRYGTAAFDQAANGVCVIGFVGEHKSTFGHGPEQRQSLRCVGGIAAGEQKGERTAAAVAQRMDFGVPSAPAHADGLRPGPPFPPAAERCAFTCVLSRRTSLGGPPINPKQKPKALSPSDPAAAWTTRGRHKVMFGYSLNYLIDMENAVILDVEATPTRLSKEVYATETMIDRTEDRFGLKPDRIAGDVAYGSGEMLGWLVGRDITPHIPVRDKSKRDDGSLSRNDFCYDKERDVYVCPQEKTLKTTGRRHGGKTLLYRSSKYDCDGCPLKPRCCPTTPSRKVPARYNRGCP